jgi:hypothetical protein
VAEVRDRASVTHAAGLLFIATLIIVIDVRVPSLDILADVAGGVLVLIAALRIRGAISGADGLRQALVILAVIALPVTFMETLAPVTGLIGLLGLSQLIGTIVLARLLAEALGRSEPALASRWRLAFQLTIWLALVPFVAGVLIGQMAKGVTIESPVVLLLVGVLAIPLVAALHALWRTAYASTPDPAAAAGSMPPAA